MYLVFSEVSAINFTLFSGLALKPLFNNVFYGFSQRKQKSKHIFKVNFLKLQGSE